MKELWMKYLEGTRRPKDHDTSNLRQKKFEVNDYDMDS
jgi:hypothetical protein